MMYSLAFLLGAPFLVCCSANKCEILGRTAWFSFCNLTRVPSIRFNTTALVLGFNYISHVNSTTFPLLENLHLLQLDNQIPGKLTIQKNSFRNLPNLVQLDLRGNRMLILDQDAFVGLSNLEILHLNDNMLNSSILENNFFRDLKYLEILDLSNNLITYLKPNPLFYHLYYFHVLNLKFNLISRICEGDLHSFHQKNFSVMDLSDNKFYQSDAWEQCGNPFRNIYFQTLILSSNGFNGGTSKALFNALNGTKVTLLRFGSHIMGPGFGYNNFKDPENSTFAGLANSNLKGLDISIGKIFSMKSYVFGYLHELQWLFISGNKINQIEREAFKGLQNLQNLNLSYNLLGELYDYMFDGLSSLVKIDLQSNHIGNIQDKTFENLPNLQYLDLQDNALKSVVFWQNMPSYHLMFIGLKDNKFRSLDSKNVMSEIINLSKNQMEDLGDLIKILQRPQIKKITLKKNRLSTCFPQQDLYISRNNSLLYLDLSENIMKLIWEYNFCLDILVNLTLLEDLLLSNNHFQFLPDGLFNGLTSLKSLNLSSNFLSYVTTRMLPVNLESLDISKNQLLSPNPERFLNLKTLDITENRFICDCNLENFVIWLNQTNTTLLGSPKHIYCIYPSFLLFTPLPDIDFKVCDDQLFFIRLTYSLFVFTSVVIVTFLTSIIVYNHFRGVFFGLYRRMVKSVLEGKVHEENEALQYDAFLCYASKDFQWVENAFIKNLDSEYCDKNRFNLCFEERNFLPGEDHIVNIRDAIWNSKKTICIVTKHFLRDGWCVEAFNYAHSRYFTDMKDVLIMVVAGSLSQYQLRKFKPIRAYMQRGQYLKWPDDYQDVDWFLSRLSYKLLKEEQVKEKKDITKGSSLVLEQIATVS